VLVGIEDGYACRYKWLSSKIGIFVFFGDENDVMNLSVKDISGIIVVSQFTLKP
jgi:D-tyrosyl-tRNA(Tyr) deacylase